MSSNNYNLESVQKLDFFSAVRKYPGMYIGSKDTDGLHHLIKEILSNSIDEYLNGSCNKIDVTLFNDGSIKIKDNGRGIPIGKKAGEKKSALELCFTEEHAGGKFLNATGTSGYNSAGGMHGLGTKCVNALSDKMFIINQRDGQIEELNFENGVCTKHTTTKTNDKETGLIVQFYPSLKYLETIDFDADRIKKQLEEFSFLCKGLTFTFYNEKTKEEVKYNSENGLYDYLNYLTKDKKMICKPFYFEQEDGTYKVEVAFGYNTNYSSVVKLYTNNIPQEKGTHLTGFKTAFTMSLNNFAKEKKWLKDKDANLTGADLDEGQLLVINFKMIDPVFKGQNKEELSSTEGRTYVQRFTSDALKDLFAINEKEVKIIFDKAVSARKAREAAKKAREAARADKKEKKNKLLALPTKLVDANSKDRAACELFISEGDSAAGGLVEARDPKIHGIFPIRGKLINLYKNSTEKVLANAEVNNLKKALGLDVDSRTGKLVYDVNKLRYGKIFTACDADSDGQAIKNLILTCLWTICPELILNGHVWITIPPLYKITEGKDTYIYLKDDEELEAYKSSHVGKKYQLARHKGLGEQDASELGPAILDPATRNVKQIIVPNKDAADELFETLMGTKVPPRRAWLLEHSEEANDNLW